ncbi:MAG: metal ABC transporter substrate-binding protein [bacterium]|nr:metal ABC transporter substrate-binding protein [bacterium]
MKKILLLLICIITLSGCFKRDDMDDIDVYTTIYPLNYIVSTLYGNNCRIHSIYPNGVDISNYELSDKELKNYSESNLFVFNSKDREKQYAVDMINLNKNLKIIDVALGMQYTNSIEELWLNPYNYLMMVQNVKNGFNEYLTNPYLIKEIDDNYEELKLKLSSLDATLKLMVKNANYNTIVVDNDVFKFLEKYGLTIISLEDYNNISDKTISDVKKMINNGTIKYIYTRDITTNEFVQNIIDNYNVEMLAINTMNSTTGGVQNNNQDYITIMQDNIDKIKLELYK